MHPQPLPHDVKKACNLLEMDPAGAWTTVALARACGVAPRTLQKHFRRFIGRTPIEYLGDVRLERARQELLRSSPGASVTEIAMRCGFNHLGRFAARYHERFGESPSATLRRLRNAVAVAAPSAPFLPMAVDRPAIAVLPFELHGQGARHACGLAEEIATAFLRLRWMAVTAPDNACYHLRGRVRDDGHGHLRVSVILLDAKTGRYLWADRWDGNRDDVFGFEERVSVRIARAIQLPLRDAEIRRASLKDPAQLNAWGLMMQALPRLLSLEAAAEGKALELLEQAMELAPQDALPLSLAAWCHGLRGSHHFSQRPEQEKEAARTLAARAAVLDTADPLAETMLAAGYTLAHDLARAAIHVDRALSLDGGSAWAWGRSGWIKAYGGEPAEAIERFQIARALAPVGDPLSFLCSFGIAGAHFEAARYDEAIRWFTRGIAEHPTAVWVNRYLVPAYALAGRGADARRGLAELTSVYPDETISRARSSLPFGASYLDRLAEGLERAGLRRLS